MDQSLYRTISVGRGLQYHYYHSPAPAARAGLPTILLLHGFPSTSHDWHHQVSYLQPRGYGILVPDMLGAGGTARPLKVEDWRMNDMAADLIDILDAHDLRRVIGVAHDWGSMVLSRLSMLNPERFVAFGWMGLPFVEPNTETFDLDAVMVLMRQYLGYEVFGYWKFLTRDDAADIIQSKVDSFIQLLYPKDPSYWNTHLARPGKTEEWMDSETKPGFPDYLDTKDIETIRRNLTQDGGVRASLNWYNSHIQNINLEDNRAIPEEKWKLQHPSFFAVAVNDCVHIEKNGVATMAEYGVEVTTVRFHTGHWVHLEAANDVNQALGEWLGSLKL